MTPARKRKITILVFSMSVLFLAAALVLYALRQNISLFYTPSQAVMGEAPQNHNIRVGGMVEKGSIVRSQKSLEVEFKITDFNKTLTVTYTGILPDLFREEQGVVAEGKLLNNRHFQASQVLAKHDANYMPPEVKAALSKKVNS
ncbi:cytochrome c maturation protein CcmE [Fluoribacter dumoffii]|uniref:Cytochrome c-type biogenesis protein CcmE n=1 Tax=Fluoribacter dumoffii TaxID=463 RepID=A0A377GAM6_9GAMM|nr:cytochrome c maturation protein CcmE [Fluoribacter dumoffii]KTC88679.1 cytochrome c-type biogenesis protein CcmE [Fluoribacter dumoffii NY 23]MCW8386028.1 cytochrome c maturation protein CcmE [Fluoribacter dumoffii]MCW8419080.1 cytochrome c maturation protein CcmE [Fluoribacter dumoffii]MCW8453076.1 cytochrome c maturation protein CcmE [Fluoribacter dumoffii]MCW8459706.1 cytochrome c maturation protein CcmE [Fluoribacter dumoffii]